IGERGVGRTETVERTTPRIWKRQARNQGADCPKKRGSGPALQPDQTPVEDHDVRRDPTKSQWTKVSELSFANAVEADQPPVSEEEDRAVLPVDRVSMGPLCDRPDQAAARAAQSKIGSRDRRTAAGDQVTVLGPQEG